MTFREGGNEGVREGGGGSDGENRWRGKVNATVGGWRPGLNVTPFDNKPVLVNAARGLRADSRLCRDP